MSNNLNPYLQKLVDARIEPLDIIHGHLKFLMLEAEVILDRCIIEEERTGEAIDSMERAAANGYLEALTNLYQLTYDLSFAISDRDKSE